MDPRMDAILPLVSCPGRYVGTEKNAVCKPLHQVRLKVALAFPDVYEVGMSHLGLAILYDILNRREDIAAERVFAPWPDMEAQMRARGIPLFSLESSHSLREFDLIGFSLQYELSYTNVLNMLDLAGIPLWAADRDERFPLIIAGGPAAMNPEPLAEFFDAMLIGDGEEAVLEICDRVAEAKEKRRPRRVLLEDLSGIEGVYVPSFFEVKYGSNGRVEAIHPLRKGYSYIQRRTLRHLDPAPYPTAPIVPWVKPVHDRLSIEIARGCKRGCRFCQAGFVYRPYRERRPDTVENLIEESLHSTGYEEVSLLSLSTGDYSSIEGLLETVMGRCLAENTAVSFPSLRVETLNAEMVDDASRVRKTGFTFAPEAATERLRKVINKEMDEEVLLRVARTLYLKGWNHIKLYFMTGLPTETEDDWKEIIPLARRVLRQGKGSRRPPRLNVSLSTFVPKPHTPFQWEPQLTLEEIQQRQLTLRRGLDGGRIRFKWHDARMSLLEGVFSRGDRRLSLVLHDAFRMGCRFDGWREFFQWETWCNAFQKNGIEMASYTRAREPSEVLPWSHIKTGVSERFLRKEWERSRRAVLTPPCRKGCTACGVCTGARLEVTSWEDQGRPSSHANLSGKGPGRAGVHVALEFHKVGPARFLGHLDMARAFHRAARRAGIPLRYSQGFHPAPRIRFEGALALGIESLCEQMEWELQGPVNEERLVVGVNHELPPGLRIGSMIRAARDLPRPVPDREKGRYLIAFAEKPPERLEHRIHEFLEHDQWLVPLDGNRPHRDIRPLVETLTMVETTDVEDRVRVVWSDILHTSKNLLEMVLVNKEGGGARVDRVIGAILSLADDQRKRVRILRLE